MTKKSARARIDHSNFERTKGGSIILGTDEEFADFCGVHRSFIFAQEFKRELTDKIIEFVNEQKITHAALAEKAGTSRPKITMILNNRSIGISTDLLVRVLSALGYRAHLTVEKSADTDILAKKAASKKVSRKTSARK